MALAVRMWGRVSVCEHEAARVARARIEGGRHGQDGGRLGGEVAEPLEDLFTRVGQVAVVLQLGAQRVQLGLQVPALHDESLAHSSHRVEEELDGLALITAEECELHGRRRDAKTVFAAMGIELHSQVDRRRRRRRRYGRARDRRCGGARRPRGRVLHLLKRHPCANVAQRHVGGAAGWSGWPKGRAWGRCHHGCHRRGRTPFRFTFGGRYRPESTRGRYRGRDRPATDRECGRRAQAQTRAPCRQAHVAAAQRDGLDEQCQDPLVVLAHGLVGVAEEQELTERLPHCSPQRVEGPHSGLADGDGSCMLLALDAQRVRQPRCVHRGHDHLLLGLLSQVLCLAILLSLRLEQLGRVLE